MADKAASIFLIRRGNLKDSPRRGQFASAIMNKEAALSIAESDFILNALREDVRLDGRHADQLRPLTLSFGDEYGHVKVQLGKTRYDYRFFAWIHTLIDTV